MKFVLENNSNTQRVTVTLFDDGNICINKEFRKSVHSEWIVGKGVRVSKDKAIFLGKVLDYSNVYNQFLSSEILA